jgi:hypothetical protein
MASSDWPIIEYDYLLFCRNDILDCSCQAGYLFYTKHMFNLYQMSIYVKKWGMAIVLYSLFHATFIP